MKKLWHYQGPIDEVRVDVGRDRDTVSSTARRQLRQNNPPLIGMWAALCWVFIRLVWDYPTWMWVTTWVTYGLCLTLVLIGQSRYRRLKRLQSAMKATMTALDEVPTIGRPEVEIDIEYQTIPMRIRSRFSRSEPARSS